LRSEIRVALLNGLIGRHADCADDELAYAHADCAEEEEIAAAELLDHQEARERGGDVYRVCDDLVDEWVFEAGIFKVLGSIVDWGL